MKKRRPKGSPAFTPAALRALLDGFRELHRSALELKSEATHLESRVSDLVNAPDGLTPKKIDLK